jgi:pilus assembly protein CpaE
MHRIVICDPIDHSREHLRGLLLGLDFAFLDAECKRYDAFLDIVADNPPDLAIIHLDADRSRAGQIVGQIADNFPHTALLVVSNNHGAILESLSSGAKHFLTEPIALEDLLRVLSKALADSSPLNGVSTTGSGLPSPRFSTNSAVVSILGSRGGIGSTTLAVNLAAGIAADPDCHVALIDLDLALGDAGVHLSLNANYTIADLAANIDKLDLNFLKRSMVKHEATGLSLLDRPVQVSDIDTIEGAHVERVLNLLKLSYSHLVVDLSKRFTPVDAAALAVSDVILLVAQLELTSVLNATRILSALAALDESGERVRLVLNRAGFEENEDERHRISLKKAEEIIGKQFIWQIPYDPRALAAARNEGVPLVRFAPRSRSFQSIQGLTDALFNKSAVVAQTASGGGFLRGLFKK